MRKAHFLLLFTLFAPVAAPTFGAAQQSETLGSVKQKYLNQKVVLIGYALLFGLLITSLCAGQQLSQRMTNQDVTDLVALGLSDDVIIEKIHAVDSTEFDTSVRGLRALKAGKVSDLVIRAMIAPHPAAAVGNIAAPANSDRDKSQLPEEVGVYFMRSGQLTQMEPEIVGWKTGGVMKQYVTLGIDKQHINGKVMKPRSPYSCPAR